MPVGGYDVGHIPLLLPKGQDAVAEIAGALERQGLSVWWDGEIPAGENFRSFIDRKLNEAPAICVVWSENSVHSRWVAEEAEEGVKRSNLIPIAIDDTELPRGFRAFQCVQLQPSQTADKYDQEFKKLVDGLRSASRTVASPTTHGKPPKTKRRGALDYKIARTQNLWMLVFFTAIALAFVFYDRLIDPSNLESLWFRIGVMLPGFFVLTVIYFFARRSWQLWIANVLATAVGVALVFYQCSMFDQPEFAADGLGTALNVTLTLAGAGVCLVHSHSSRAASLLVGIGTYAFLAHRGGADSLLFWVTMLANTGVMSVLIWNVSPRPKSAVTANSLRNRELALLRGRTCFGGAASWQSALRGNVVELTLGGGLAFDVPNRSVPVGGCDVGHFPLLLAQRPRRCC